MPEITFKAAFGDEIKAVRLFQPSGAANTNYYLMVDNYVHGQINKMSDGWHVFFNPESSYTKEDADVLIEMVTGKQFEG